MQDFKYLGSWITDRKRYMEVRIGLAWKALNKLDKIWKSKLRRKLKIQFFRLRVERDLELLLHDVAAVLDPPLVLPYGAESWTLTNIMCRRLDGTHTRMLRAFKGFNFREWKTNNKRYGKPSKVTSMLKVRLLKSLDRCGAENQSWYARCSCGNQIMNQIIGSHLSRIFYFVCHQ